jgi:hypothetical protein
MALAADMLFWTSANTIDDSIEMLGSEYEFTEQTIKRFVTINYQDMYELQFR